MGPGALVEGNETEFLLALGRAGGGEERNDDRVQWIIGGSPLAYHNAVVRADLDPSSADEAIESSMAAMDRHGVPGSWHVGPGMGPSDLGTRLSDHGFEGGPEPGMIADLRDIPAVDVPHGLDVGRVTTQTDLDAFEDVLASGFGEGPTEAAWVCAMYAQIGLGDDVAWRHYLGRLGSDAVATTSLFLTGDAAGIYFVCTRPELRGLGIGASITHAAMTAAKELGYEKAVLGSSPMGHRIYERLGFRDVCDIHVYEWSPR